MIKNKLVQDLLIGDKSFLTPNFRWSLPQPRSKALEIAKAVWKPAVSLAGDLSSQYSETHKNASAATQAHVSATSFGTKGNTAILTETLSHCLSKTIESGH